ncbi:MAG: glycosyltransferase [Dehalococcoidales bacterium]
MKILQVFDYFSPHGGGTVDVLYKLSRGLAQRDHEVTIYTSDFKLDQAYIDSLPEVKIYPFHCISNLGSFYVMPDIIKESKARLKEFDIVHLHCFRSFQNIVIYHYSHKYGVPYIIDSHGSLPRIAAGEAKPKWLLRWLFDVLFGYRILRDAAGVIAENKFGLKEYDSFGRKIKKAAIIPYFFPIDEFTNLPPRGQFRHRFNLGSKKVVMSLGRIHHIKGLDFLVESFHELAQTREDVVLAICGNDDGYRSQLQNLVARLNLSDRVIFPGFLAGQDKLAALVDADVVVQPSRYEYAAWAPIEAVLCGTPIIVSAGSGSGEDVTRMDAGYLVNYGDKLQMSRTLQQILDDPTEAREKARRAGEYIRANLSVNKMAEEYERLYQNCIQANSPLRRGI